MSIKYRKTIITTPLPSEPVREERTIPLKKPPTEEEAHRERTGKGFFNKSDYVLDWLMAAPQEDERHIPDMDKRIDTLLKALHQEENPNVVPFKNKPGKP